jgi:hypothetical protein
VLSFPRAEQTISKKDFKCVQFRENEKLFETITAKCKSFVEIVILTNSLFF